MHDELRCGGAEKALVGDGRAVDERRKTLQGELDEARARRNAANERMAKLDKKGPEFAAARDELRELSQRIKTGEAEEKQLEEQSLARLQVIPNAPHASVPDGAGADDNPV